MGQYFRLLNLDKREYVDPWDVGGVAKLWEWCANNQCRVIPFLLRQSSEGGGGDIQEDYSLAGHWAGDRVVLVGDYDDSKLFDIAEKEFMNISKQLVKEFNDFIHIKDYQLEDRVKERG